jgi:hypothetical protein
VGLSPKEAIKLERVESKPALIKPNRPVGRKEKRLKKGDSVRYLLAPAEYEGGFEHQKRATDPNYSPQLYKIRKVVVSSKKEPTLYYLEGDYAPARAFVLEELMLIENVNKIQNPPQWILEENNRSQKVNVVQINGNKIAKAEEYARRRGGQCLGKTGRINEMNIFL